MLLKFAIKEFLDEREFRQVSPKTITNYKFFLGDFHSYCTNNEIIDISDITQSTIKSFLLYCQKKKGNNPTTVNTKLQALKAFFNYLEEIELITTKQNPCKKVGYIKAEVKATTFTDAQVKEILDYFRRFKRRDKSFYAYRDYAIVIFLLSTGCRCGEMCNQKWADVDLTNNHMVVYGKLRTQQGVPIVESLSKELQEWKIFCEKEFKKFPEYVFVNRKGQRLTEGAVQSIFKRVKEVMGFKDVRCCAHDFRRYFAKSLVIQGADAFTVQKLLRHAKLDMSVKYVGLYGQDLKKRNEEFNPLNNLDI